MNLFKKCMLLLGSLCLSANMFAQQFYDEGISYEVTSEENATVRVCRVNRCMHSFVVPAIVHNYSGVPYRVTSIGNNGFRSACSLVDIDLNDVEILEDGYIDYYPDGSGSACYGAFYGCRELQKVSLLKVKRIGDYGFYECEMLKDMEFGPNLKSIGKKAFVRSESLEKLKMNVAVPPQCAADAFTERVFKLAVLQVPQGKKSVYQNADVWNKFLHIEEIGEHTGVGAMDESEDLRISTDNGHINIQGLHGEQEVAVFNKAGQKIVNKIVQGDRMQLSVPASDSYVVRIGSRSWKVVF